PRRLEVGEPRLQALRVGDAVRDVLQRRPGRALLRGLRGPRLLRRLARLRERARLRRDPVVVQPGGPRGQGRHLLVVSAGAAAGARAGPGKLANAELSGSTT